MEQKHVDTYKNLLSLDSKTATRDLKQARGRQFESLLNDLFEDEGILLRRSYWTTDNRSEQIDGAIEVYNRIFLIEVKWVESNMAASELYAFIGKTENKFQGTLGVFISKEKLSENFLNSLNKGRRQSIIVIHGKDVDLIFSEKVNLEKYITYAFKLLSYDNAIHFSVEEYLKITQSKPLTSPGSKQQVVDFVKSTLLSKNISEVDLILEINNLTEDEKNLTFEYVIKFYSVVWYHGLNEFDFKATTNFDNYIKNYLLRDNSLLKELTKTYYSELIMKAVEVYARPQFVNLFSPIYSQLDDDTKSIFETYIIDAWTKHFNDWNRENNLTEVVKPIWEELSTETRRRLSEYYLDIYISTDRENRFAQKRFSYHLLANGLIEIADIAIWLDNKLKQSIEAFEEITDDKVQFIAYTYSSIAKQLKIDPEKWTNHISNRISKIINTE